MALKIRLARGGAKKRPYFRIVVADTRSPRDGRFIERLGSYDPMAPRDHPRRTTLKQERIEYWLSVGASPTDRVARLLGADGIIAAPPIREQTKKNLPRPKTLERRKAAAEAAAAAPEPAADTVAGSAEAGAPATAAATAAEETAVEAVEEKVAEAVEETAEAPAPEADQEPAESAAPRDETEAAPPEAEEPKAESAAAEEPAEAEEAAAQPVKD